jgi:hypothetical protein
MARAFLVEVARGLGREEVDCPFIKKLIVEEWIDSVDDLRQVSVERWEAFRLEYRIPARFLDAVSAALSTAPASVASNVPVPAKDGSTGTAKVDAVEPELIIARPRPWASAPRFMLAAMNDIWSHTKGLPSALERVLLTDRAVRTYGILGKTMDEATLAGVAQYAKTSWLGEVIADEEFASEELFGDVHLLHAVEPPKPPPEDHYGAVLVLCDCGLEDIRARLQFASELRDSGVYGDGASLQVVAMDSLEGASYKERIRDMTKEVLGPDVRPLVFRARSSPEKRVAGLLRGWLRVAPEVELGSPLLLVSSQPYALWHHIIMDKVLRENSEWSARWPSSLAHVAAAKAPPLPQSQAMYALGRLLGEMDARSKKQLQAAPAAQATAAPVPAARL